MRVSRRLEGSMTERGRKSGEVGGEWLGGSLEEVGGEWLNGSLEEVGGEWLGGLESG